MVMKPEPWGEALDAVSRRRRPAPPSSYRPRRRAVHPGGRRRAGHPRAPRLRVRPLRGHRPAGDGRSRLPDGGARALDRRLRAQRGRGRGAGDRGGRRPPAARVHGQRGVPRPRSRTPPDCWSTPSTPSPTPGAATRCPTCFSPGDHARIATWRHDQSVRRTAERRPDLAHPSPAVDLGELEGQFTLAAPADAAELLTLQRACWVQEQQANPGVEIPAQHESLADVQAWLQEWTTLVLRSGGRLIGAAAAAATATPGTSAASWSPPTCRAEGSAGCC